MNNSLIRKGLVLGIIVIFIGTCAISSMGEIIDKSNNSSLISIISRGIILYVGGSGPDNYTKIQYAIDNASNGDTIFVYSDSSPYYENVVVDKSINLIGENRTKTTIVGNYSSNSVYVNASYVNIKGFSIIRGNMSGIRLWQSEGCSIVDNIIELNKKYGIYLSKSSNNTISENVIQINDNGIILNFKSNFNTIKDNNIASNENGIYLESSSENTITENKILQNKYGIKLYSKSRYNAIQSNTISNNNLGIFLGGSIYPTFIINILLDGSIHNEIIKNNFFDNSQDAFFQNSRRNRWWRNYWNETRILPKLIFGELFICRLQGMPPTAVEHHIPWIPRIDWRPALRPFTI